jgi:hypothetical protein
MLLDMSQNTSALYTQCEKKKKREGERQVRDT